MTMLAETAPSAPAALRSRAVSGEVSGKKVST